MHCIAATSMYITELTIFYTRIKLLISGPTAQILSSQSFVSNLVSIILISVGHFSIETGGSNEIVKFLQVLITEVCVQAHCRQICQKRMVEPHLV